jgi:hypothetical protein
MATPTLTSSRFTEAGTAPSTVKPYWRPLSAAEIVLWCLLYALAVAGFLYRAGGPGLSDDSYQYLSEAGNICAGNGLTTSIVHFDTERSHGQLPAPLTTFPPGYSLAIAALTRTGLVGETAGLLLSAASFICLVPLIACAARLLELGAMATRMALVLLLGSFAADLYATAVSTESLFTALSLGALVCLLLYERGTVGTPAAAAGNLLVGCACWVRYAGLFLFVAVGAYLAWRALRERDRRSVTAAACLALPAGLISYLLARNVILTGSWKGGNTKAVVHPLMEVLKQFVISTYRLVFGEGVPTRLGVLQATLCVGLAVLSVLLFKSVARVRTSSEIRTALRNASPSAGLLLIYVVVYNAGMIYLGMSSVISFGARMFYPLLPIYFLLSGLVLTRVQSLAGPRSTSQTWTMCAAMIIGSYWGINFEKTLARRSVPPDRAVEASFALPSGTGGSLRSWFDANVPLNAVLVATNGQATAYALKRNVVSLVRSNFSDQRWDEKEVRAVMQQYGASFLILYPRISPAIEPVQQESAFLQELLERQRPQWLQLAAENDQVMIFRRSATWVATSLNQ